MSENLKVTLGLVIVILGGYAAYALINALIKAINQLDPGVSAAIIAGASTVVTSVFIASYNARKAKERQAVEANRGKKAAAYMEFMDTIIKAMRSAKSNDDTALPAKELEEFFYGFTSTVAVYGGPGVVKSYGDWRSASTEGSPMSALAKIDNLIREMRSDLGESNKGLQTNELLSLFIIGGRSQLTKALEE